MPRSLGTTPVSDSKLKVLSRVPRNVRAAISISLRHSRRAVLVPCPPTTSSVATVLADALFRHHHEFGEPRPLCDANHKKEDDSDEVAVQTTAGTWFPA